MDQILKLPHKVGEILVLDISVVTEFEVNGLPLSINHHLEIRSLHSTLEIYAVPEVYESQTSTSFLV